MQLRISILILLVFYLSSIPSIGQEIKFQHIHPVILPKVASPSVPIVSENNSKDYFLRQFYGRNGIYGGILPKEVITFDENVLLFFIQTPTTFLNSENQNALIGVDTNIVYYYNRNLSQNKFRGIFWSSTAMNEDDPPQKLEIGGFDLTKVHSFYMSPTMDILLFSLAQKEGQGQEDLYVSVFENGNWGTPINLGNTINTADAEISPFLSKDKTTLFFSSTGHTGFGKSDIFMARRMYNSWKVWSQPTNLGPEINSSGHESYLSIPDDTTAYFISNKSGWGTMWQASLEANPPNPFRHLPGEREYLTQEEIIDLFGFSIDSTLSFNPNEMALTSQSRELLWFVANNIISKADIFINIVFLPNADKDEVRSKSTVIEEYFRFLGITRNRITIHTLQDDNLEVETNSDAIFNFYLKK